jgi:hypothetical protein
MAKHIYFTDDRISFKISDILAKNGIDDTPLDSAFQDKETPINIIHKLAKNLAEERISENDFIESTKTKLKTTDLIAQSILNDIKKDLLPFAKVENESENKNLEEKPKEKKTPVIPQKKKVSSVSDKYLEKI